LVMNLVIEVLRQASIGSMLIRISSSCDKLLQLNTCNEVFILRSHQAIVLREQEDLVISLSSLRILHEKCSTLLLRQVGKLLRVGDKLAMA